MSATATSPKGRGPSTSTPAMRRAILDAATFVFAESGYRAGSVRAIGDRVGISDAGVLHHFGSKNNLLAAVLDWRDERIAPLLPPPGTAGMETFSGLLRVADYIPTEPGIARLHCTLLAESTDAAHPAHEFFVARYERTRGELVDAFLGAQRAGHLKPGIDPELAATSTLALLDGLQLQWLLHPTAVDITTSLRAHLETLLDGLSATSSAD